MRVIVRLYGILRELTGYEVLTIELNSEKTYLCDVIARLLNVYPGLSQFIKLEGEGIIEVKGVTVIVNGRHAVFLGGERTVVKDGDVIDLVPPLHGGRGEIRAFISLYRVV